MGLSKEEAGGYNDYIERGDILVMVDEHPDRDAYGNFYENNSVLSLIKNSQTEIIKGKQDRNN